MGGRTLRSGGLIAMRVLGAVIGGAAVLLFGLIGAGVSGMLSAIAGASFPSMSRREVGCAYVNVRIAAPQTRE